MKKIYSLQLYVWLFLTILFSQCTKVDLEEGVRKTTILRHNYIAITTKDDIPGEVEVHYSILGNNGQNEVKTERLSTPCVIGGENVLVAYDSIVGTHSGKSVFSQLIMKRDYQETGADFLSIKNLSSTVLEYAVIGNQPLVFHNSADLKEYHNFTNLNEIKKYCSEESYKIFYEKLKEFEKEGYIKIEDNFAFYELKGIFWGNSLVANVIEEIGRYL